MKLKLLVLAITIVLMLPISVKANNMTIETEYGYYKPETDLSIYILVKNDTDFVTGASCSADILHPNKTIWLDDISFTEYGSGHYYNNTYDTLSVGGDYFLWVNCSKNSEFFYGGNKIQVKTWIDSLDDIRDNQLNYFSEWNASFYLWNETFYVDWNGSIMDLDETANWDRLWKEFDCDYPPDNEICKYLDDIEGEAKFEGLKTRTYIDYIVENGVNILIVSAIAIFLIVLFILALKSYMGRE